VGIQPRTGVDTVRVTQQPGRCPELDRLNIFIGRSMTEGETIAQADAPFYSDLADMRGLPNTA